MKHKIIILTILLSGIYGEINCQPLYSGTLNNIVVLINFNESPGFCVSRNKYEELFNSSTGMSVKNYFRTISDGHLNVQTHIYPVYDGSEGNFSIQLKYCFYCYDALLRAGFTKKCGSVPTTSYGRIYSVIKEVIDSLQNKNAVPADLNIDNNNDGYVDNITLLISGSPYGSQKVIMSPYSETMPQSAIDEYGDIELNGKKIKNYTITYERSELAFYCKELLVYYGFEPLYLTQTGIPRPVGQYDPMDGPELTLPLTYTRWRYSSGEWIDDIPQISTSGTYYLQPSGQEGRKAYKITSVKSSGEFFVLEYRKKTNTFESPIKQSGLIIYKIDPSGDRAIEDPEIYIFRPDGTKNVNGSIDDATFSSDYGRSEINAGTNPYLFSQAGSLIDDIDISDIIETGDSISFQISGDLLVTGINTITGQNEFNVWPIPANDKIWVSDDFSSLRIYTVQGTLVSSFGHTPARKYLDISELQAGYYLLRITKENKTTTIRLIKR